MKVKKLLFGLVAMCFLVACETDSEMRFYLTNPSDGSIQVDIDNIKYDVAPNEIVKLKLDEGTHTMLLADNEPVQFKIFKGSKGGIINPTKSLHVVYTMIYIVEEKDASGFGPAENTVLIDGVEYSGPLRTIDDMFIDNNIYQCSYFTGEPFPDEITTWNKESKGNLKSKFFTKQEFIDFYSKELLEEANYHDTYKVPGGQTLITEVQTHALPVADFKNEQIQEQANKMIATLKAYIEASDGSEQEKFQKQFNTEFSALASIEKDYSDVEENKKFNKFVSQSSSMIDIGIIGR